MDAYKWNSIKPYVVSRGTAEKLVAFESLLQQWQRSVNLVSSATLARCWERHILDSAQLFPLISQGPVADLGSGAGFPGLVLAILGAHPVHLIESDSRKATFLAEASRRLEVPATIHQERIETCRIPDVKTITSRACAPLGTLLLYAQRFMSSDTICLFPKGKNYSTEVSDAKKDWDFVYDCLPSASHSDGMILRIREFSLHERTT